MENKQDKCYISQKDKYFINHIYFAEKLYNKNMDKIDIKKIVSRLKGKYACYEVLKYLQDNLLVKRKRIKRGSNLKYLNQLTRGHWQLTNDLYFNKRYVHQYVTCKELGLGIEQVENYIIHHLDMDKSNNRINNLFIFFDRNAHCKFHQELKKDKTIDIIEFNTNYMKKHQKNLDKNEIKKYRKILDKLITKQKGFFTNETDYEIQCLF